MANILILDSQSSGRHVVASSLRKHGHTVAQVGDADEALRLVRLDRPDLLVVDIAAPDIDGCRFAMQIRCQLGEHAQPLFQRGRFAAQAALLAHVAHARHDAAHTRVVQVADQLDRKQARPAQGVRRTRGGDQRGLGAPGGGACAVEHGDELAGARLVDQVIERNAQRLRTRSPQHLAHGSVDREDTAVRTEQQTDLGTGTRERGKAGDRVARIAPSDALGRHVAQPHHRNPFGLDSQQRSCQLQDQRAAVGGAQLGALRERFVLEQPAPQGGPAPREVAVAGVTDQLRQVPADQGRALQSGKGREGAVGRQDLGRRVQAHCRPRQQLERLASERRLDR